MRVMMKLDLWMLIALMLSLLLVPNKAAYVDDDTYNDEGEEDEEFAEVGVPLSSTDHALMKFLKKASYGRDRVVEWLLNEYTTQNPDKDKDDLLNDAFEAMYISETDNEPVQIKGHDFLFVGSVGKSSHKNHTYQVYITTSTIPLTMYVFFPHQTYRCI